MRPTDVLRVLPKLVWQYGQPFGDPSAVPTYLVSRLARRHVKVCVSGDGADESFAGYWRVQAGIYAARYATIVPRIIRRKVVPVLAEFLGGNGARLAAMNQLSLAAPGAGYTNSQSWYDALLQVAGPELRAGLEHDYVACRVGRAHAGKHDTVVQQLLFDDFQVQLPDAYLTKVDVASMAASLEVRAPFLDVAVIEAAWKLPDRMKVRWGERKWILKRIAARYVPPEVVYRRKQGFAMPLEHWFRGDLGRLLAVLLKESFAEQAGWINAKRVLGELSQHRSGGRDNHARLWLILWLELWFRVVQTRELQPGTDLSDLLDACAF